MQSLSNNSLSQLQTLEAKIVVDLKKRYFLGVNQAREQIPHIASAAGISVREFLAAKEPKEPKESELELQEAKFLRKTSIDVTVIRDQMAGILEGGQDAFIQREENYEF